MPRYLGSQTLEKSEYGDRRLEISVIILGLP